MSIMECDSTRRNMMVRRPDTIGQVCRLSGFVGVTLAVLVGCDPGPAANRETPTQVAVISGEKQSVEAQQPELSGAGDRIATETSALVGAEAGQERDDNVLKMTFVWCPPGTFTMGSPATELGASGSHNDEERQVAVTLTSGFWLGRTEVTQAQWRSLMGTTPWKGREAVIEGDDYAATCITWDEAEAFCKTMSDKDGKAYRLPSEAEWEYACRAGTTSPFSFGADEALVGQHAWYRQNTLDVGQIFAHEVGQKKANPWGLVDMHGNVWEWCEDVFAERLPGGTDPVVTGSGSKRVRRGGSFPHVPNVCRSAFRGPFEHSPGYPDLGFRVALNPDSN
jgi:sulfatase modifying factor 1